jgi:hypothetical protein
MGAASHEVGAPVLDPDATVHAPLAILSKPEERGSVLDVYVAVAADASVAPPMSDALKHAPGVSGGPWIHTTPGAASAKRTAARCTAFNVASKSSGSAAGAGAGGEGKRRPRRTSVSFVRAGGGAGGVTGGPSSDSAGPCGGRTLRSKCAIASSILRGDQ